MLRWRRSCMLVATGRRSGGGQPLTRGTILQVVWEGQPRSLGRIARSMELAGLQSAPGGDAAATHKTPAPDTLQGGTALAAWRPPRRRGSASDVSDATESTVVENPMFVAAGDHLADAGHQRSDGAGPSRG